MREMKDSGIEWIGAIPADWTLQRGKTIFVQRLTKGNQSEILLAATQKYGMLPQSKIEGVVQVKEDADLQQFRTVHKKDFVISLRSFQGGFEYSQYEGVCSPAYQVFYNITPICHNYYRLLFKSDGFIQKMNSMTVGIREGKNIQYSDFANSLIPVPPIDQQQRIADYLDRKCSQIDAIIARQQEVIEKLKAYKLSVITEAVTKGLNPDVPMKDSGVEWIGEIPEHWVLIKATRIIISTQNGLTRRDLDKSTGQIVLKLRNISSAGEIDYEYQNRIELTRQELDTYRLNEGDFLFVRVNGSKSLVGKCAIFHSIGEDVAYNDHIIRVRISQKCMERFFFWYLLSICGKTEIDLHTSTSAGQYTISGEGLRDTRLVLPPKTEQIEIDAHLSKICSSIDKVILQKQTSIDKLTAYKKSLIYEVVTGKREV